MFTTFDRRAFALNPVFSNFELVMEEGAGSSSFRWDTFILFLSRIERKTKMNGFEMFTRSIYILPLL